MTQLIEDHALVREIAPPLADDESWRLVERLKAEADRYWAINANRSLEFADQIVQIGRARGDSRQIALGTMARGDALKLLGRNIEAWEALDEAGNLFQQAADEVGWARTRIGRLLICVDLNCVNEALADAERAREIFVRHNLSEKLLVLDLNTAIVYDLLGDHRHALALYCSALAAAKLQGAAGEKWLGSLYTNIGLAYESLGNLREALVHHERAHGLWVEREETSVVAIAELNIAHIAVAQGHYRRALSLLHRAYELKVAEQIPLDAAHIERDMAECYLLLNRYVEASDLARRARTAFQMLGAAYEEAITLLHLATAEAQLGQFVSAQAALDAAQALFASLGASAWVATTQLRRGRIAFQQGNTTQAHREGIAAAQWFESDGQQVKHATAVLLQGQILLAEGDLPSARHCATQALHVARHCNVPSLRYAAHLLLGRIAEAQGRLLRAARRYRAAAATVDRVQRGLTITLRPGFLEDKAEALQALLALYLRTGQAQRAFETLERAKSQALLSYLANRDQFRWADGDARSRTLIEELEQLRGEHQWLYEQAHDLLTSDDGRPHAFSPEQALAEVAVRERRMRTITEQLYLHSGASSVTNAVTLPSLRDIQRSLDDALLIEFYNDGANTWVFSLDADSLQVHPLSTTVAALDHLLTQFQVNVAAALKAGPTSPTARSLTNLAQRILQRLYAALLKPVQARMTNRQRLVIVPYGSLHYLPFHLLHTGTEYLIEQQEVVVLPAAGLVPRRGPVRSGGALVLAHSRDGLLSQTQIEADLVHRLFGGKVCYDQAACRTTLAAQPTQILHIAAHGEHRLDQPDLSYIQLSDGQLYTDDLLQHNLSYELVTLSACETGRAHVAAGDELIGLGRGFLYAGAGALITSLWRVSDDSAIALMEQVYQQLSTGVSKAAALREAQRMILDAETCLHPAFWGAFQLIGDPRPLSHCAELVNTTHDGGS